MIGTAVFDVAVTRAMTSAEVEQDYEANTLAVIVEAFQQNGVSADYGQ